MEIFRGVRGFWFGGLDELVLIVKMKKIYYRKKGLVCLWNMLWVFVIVMLYCYLGFECYFNI